VFVCILPEKTIPEMTYTVSGGTLNPTHSLTHFIHAWLSCASLPLHQLCFGGGVSGQQSCSKPGWISTWMSDCLWAGKPSWYVTSRLGQLGLPSLWGR